MKILVLGATGMLGHKMMQILAERFEVVGTVRGAPSPAPHPLLARAALRGGVSAEDFDGVMRAIAQVRPDAIVNCIGIVKQLGEAKDPLRSITINALFPHRLAQLCQAAGIRLVHISTDCVFSGRKGRYTEGDQSDAEDLYGRTKYLGEVGGIGCLTVRTSMIGRELKAPTGLVEWLIAQSGRSVRGYTRAIFTGFTTRVLAGIIADILDRLPDLCGVWHVSADPIDKHDLLHRINAAMGLGVEIHPDDTFVCDRSLDSSRFRQASGFQPPAWDEMIAGLAQERGY